MLGFPGSLSVVLAGTAHFRALLSHRVPLAVGTRADIFIVSRTGLCSSHNLWAFWPLLACPCRLPSYWGLSVWAFYRAGVLVM